MPNGIPLGQPDRYLRDRYISREMFARMPNDLKVIYIGLCGGDLIGVHHRANRNRYTLAGKPITRRTIDRLVYFGVLDETELQNDLPQSGGNV